MLVAVDDATVSHVLSLADCLWVTLFRTLMHMLSVATIGVT